MLENDKSFLQTCRHFAELICAIKGKRKKKEKNVVGQHDVLCTVKL